MVLCYLHGNDAANVLAETVSGNIDNFIELMNKKATEIGCTNTHFTNPHGFHDENHYSSAYDMAKILRYALSNDTFKEIFETKTVQIPATNKTTTIRNLTNTNKLVNKDYASTYYYEYAVAGKTGFTDEARGTLVTYGKKDGKEVIITVFDGTQLLGNEVRYFDAKLLFEYSFSTFNNSVLLENDRYKFDIYDENTDFTYTLKLKDNIVSLSNGCDNAISYKNLKFDLNKLQDIVKNINIYDNDLSTNIVGNVEISINGNDIYLAGNYDLILDSYKNNSTLLKKILNNDTYIIITISVLFSIMLILIIINIVIKSKMNKNDELKFSDSPRIKLRHHKENF